MYLDFFGLRAKPFSKTPDPAFLYPSRQHAEALARLSHAVEEREVAVLTGDIGAGKTTLSRALVDAFADRCRFTLVVNAALPPGQLLASVAEGFGVREARRKSGTWSALADALARLDAEGLFPVVIVDEAQLLASRAAYDELRLLTNLTADDRPLIGLLLIGQPELRDRLREKGGEAFAQRVGVAYHVGPLDREETGRYVAHRLSVAGRSAPLFEPAALDALHRRSAGVPRLINRVASGALLEAFARDQDPIRAESVEAAAADLDTYMGAPRESR